VIRFRPTLTILALAALNAAVWAVSLAASPLAAPPLRLFAEYLSTSALIIMSANLMLATRLGPLEAFFGGLDKLFTAHRLNGLVAATAISTHFLLMPYKTPGWTPARLVGVPTLTLIVVMVLVAIAPRAPWRRLVPLRYENWKLTHRFNGLLVAAGVTHSLLAHADVAAMPLLRMWVYGFATLGLLAYAYRETAERFVAERHVYKVGDARHIGDDVIEIPLAPTQNPIAFAAGQFAFVRFEGGPTREQHPFTISMAPAGGPLRFSIKASGDYTHDLQRHLAPGSVARIEGPYGRFDYHSGTSRQLWIAGGIGITPFLAFAGCVGPDHDVRFIWTVRTESDAVYRHEIETALAERPNVRFSVHPTSTAGHLQLADLDLAEPSELSVYLCGPVPMRDAFISQLLALGVPRNRIFYEEFSLR
jgi:predicted ferric reductase